MTTATQPIARPTIRARIFALLAEHGPLSAAAIAARLGIRASDAAARTRAYARAGYLDRDEFGRFSTWCAWPRVGL